MQSTDDSTRRLRASQQEAAANAARIAVSKYYSDLFPYDDLFAWLFCNKHADQHDQSSCLKHREFSFVLQNNVYSRYMSFLSSIELRQAMLSSMPSKLDLGACYNMPTRLHASPAFAPVLRELVFDIDLSDYDDVRTSAKDATITQRCWRFMAVAVKVLDLRLRCDFGFKHLFWVYSGRRGIHCWVCDRRAMRLDNSARTAIVEYLSVIHGTATKAQIMQLMHDEFVSDTIQAKGQALLSDPAHFNRILRFVPTAHNLRADLQRDWLRPQTPESRWQSLKSKVASLRLQLQIKLQAKSQTNKNAASRAAIQAAYQPDSLKLLNSTNSTNSTDLSSLKQLACKIVFKCLYPRLDVRVTTHTTHLLKAPFSLHPETNRVCVPIDPACVDAFDVLDVPTAESLVAEDV